MFNENDGMVEVDRSELLQLKDDDVEIVWRFEGDAVVAQVTPSKLYEGLFFDRGYRWMIALGNDVVLVSVFGDAWDRWECFTSFASDRIEPDQEVEVSSCWVEDVAVLFRTSPMDVEDLGDLERALGIDPFDLSIGEPVKVSQAFVDDIQFCIRRWREFGPHEVIEDGELDRLHERMTKLGWFSQVRYL